MLFGPFVNDAFADLGKAGSGELSKLENTARAPNKRLKQTSSLQGGSLPPLPPPKKKKKTFLSLPTSPSNPILLFPCFSYPTILPTLSPPSPTHSTSYP